LLPDRRAGHGSARFHHHRNADLRNADGDSAVHAALDSAVRFYLPDSADAAGSADHHARRAGTVLYRDSARHLSEGPWPGIVLARDGVHRGIWFRHARAGRPALSQEAGLMFGRIIMIVRKEIRQISRDKGLVRMVAFAPVLQLLIYG